MAEEPAKTPDTSAPNPNAVFTEEQRGVFRSAGLWMMLVGWIEVLAGSLMGLAWLLGVLDIAPQLARQVVGTVPSDWATAGIRFVGAIAIGVLTLIAASSFRRAGTSLESVTKAVSNLQELYERQVWLFAILLAVVVGTVILAR